MFKCHICTSITQARYLTMSSLDPVIEKTPLFNLDMYLYQLTSDLDQHAQYLHSRDVHNMVKFMHAHREFQFLKPSSSSSSERKSSSIPPGSSLSEHQPNRRGRPRGSSVGIMTFSYRRHSILRNQNRLVKYNVSLLYKQD